MTGKSNSAIRETEEELVLTAQNAVSRCNWVVGECASKWTKKYAKGRTDVDFGALIGLSGDQAYQRRRVWETFGDVFDDYRSLRWSHFYVALNWDDAPECLAWAEENKTTVAEMRAWRRAQRGEDLTVEPADDDWASDPMASFMPDEPTAVRDPATFGGEGARPAAGGAGTPARSGENPEMVAGVARESDSQNADYAPYRRGAGSPAPKEETSDVALAEKPLPSPGQLIKRITNSLQRINQTLTPEMLKELRRFPEKQRNRLIKEVGELSSKVAELM